MTENSVRSDAQANQEKYVSEELVKLAVEAKGGKWAARARAMDLQREYMSLDRANKVAFFGALERAIAPSREQEDDKAASAAGSLNLLEFLNNGPAGIRFIVQLRADAMADKGIQRFPILHCELLSIVESIFDFGFLTFKPLTWEMSAAILEKLFGYEAVHQIQSWEDLKSRLTPPRQCFGLFHPAMGDDPLIFVEIAFTKGIARRIGQLVGTNADVLDPGEADTAMFYSISNTHKGLIGVKFGDYLLKCAFPELSAKYPNLRQFVTLSPIPGFRAWLSKALPEDSSASVEIRKLREIAKGTDLFPQGWFEDRHYAESLKPILLRLCARYLVQVRRGKEAADPVAEFHFGNGCSVDRVNWLADLSPRGMARSAGIMVNYDYVASRIEERHHKYVSSQTVSISAEVRQMLSESAGLEV